MFKLNYRAKSLFTFLSFILLFSLFAHAIVLTYQVHVFKKKKKKKKKYINK